MRCKCSVAPGNVYCLFLSRFLLIDRGSCSYLIGQEGPFSDGFGCTHCLRGASTHFA